MSHCKDCCSAARRVRYHANVSHERERSRNYYRSLPEDERRARVSQAKVRVQAWYKADPERARQVWRDQKRSDQRRPAKRQATRQRERASYMKRHGGTDEWARMFAEQDGLCYLCQEPLPAGGKDVHVDHDHTCCEVGPRESRSCQYCRRGLTHQACNQIWGLARENPAMLRLLADNGERVRDETRRRISARPATQGVLGVDAQGATAMAAPAPEAMPDLDMPTGVPWPLADDAALF